VKVALSLYSQSNGELFYRWVVGALDSAWRAVYEYLIASGQYAKIPKFFRLWGRNIEWTQPSCKYEHRPEEAEGEYDPGNTLLRVHMGYTYAAELSGDVKF